MSGGTATRPHVKRPIVAAVVLGLLLLAALGWAATRVWHAASALQDAARFGTAAVAAGEAGDLGALRTSLTGLAQAGVDAGGAADDPTWQVAAALPIIGDDVDAIGVLARAARVLGTSVASPTAAALASADTGARNDSLAQWGPALTEAVAGVADARNELASLDRATLIPPVRTAVDRISSALDQLAPVLNVTRAGAAVAGTVEAGTAQVLVLMQNGAELRTGGGITGAFALLEISDGKVRLEAQADSSSFSHLREPILPTSAAQTALYGDVVGRFVQNSSMPVDFSETAALASAWWEQAGHAAPDLVVSLDVPAIGALLHVLGPVTLPDGSELSERNIVQRLLVDPYLQLDAGGQTELMQSAVAAAVAAATSTPVDPLRWLSALTTPIAEGRVSIWSADAQVEALLQGSVLGGPAARLAAAGTDAFAVFFNDGTGGKMDGYLHIDMEARSAVCRPDGLADVVVELTMRSSAPQDAGSSFPGDVTGRGLFGTGVGDIGTSVSVSAPPGSYVAGVTKDGARVLSVDVEDGARPTSLARINLSPGEVNVVQFRFTMHTPGPVTPVLVHTPLLNAPVITVTGGDCA